MMSARAWTGKGRGELGRGRDSRVHFKAPKDGENQRSKLVYFRANRGSLLNLPNQMNLKIFIFSFHSSRK